MRQATATALQIVISPPRQKKSKGGEQAAISSFPAKPVRVFVLRVEPLRVIGLQALFEGHPGIEILAEGAKTAVDGWRDPSVEVVVIGAQLGTATLRLISTIRAERPALNILIMSPAAGDEAILSVLNLGAKGFLHEGSTAEQFEEAVRTVASGSLWAPRRLQAELIQRLLRQRGPGLKTSQSSLTEREQQVLDLLSDGKSNREIAQSLSIEERTVKSYVTRLLQKMSVKNRTALSVLAMTAKGHPAAPPQRMDQKSL